MRHGESSTWSATARSVVEAATVRRLLETIEQRLSRLARPAGVPLEDYLEDGDLQAIVER